MKTTEVVSLDTTVFQSTFENRFEVCSTSAPDLLEMPLWGRDNGSATNTPIDAVFQELPAPPKAPKQKPSGFGYASVGVALELDLWLTDGDESALGPTSKAPHS